MYETTVVVKLAYEVVSVAVLFHTAREKEHTDFFIISSTM